MGRRLTDVLAAAAVAGFFGLAAAILIRNRMPWLAAVFAVPGVLAIASAGLARFQARHDDDLEALADATRECRPCGPPGDGWTPKGRCTCTEDCGSVRCLADLWPGI